MLPLALVPVAEFLVGAVAGAIAAKAIPERVNIEVTFRD